VRVFLLSVAAGLLIVAGVAAYGEFVSLRQSLATGQQALASASSGISGGALDRAVAGDVDLSQSCADLSTAAGAFGDAAESVNRMAPLVRLVEQVPATAARTESSIALVAVATEVSAAGDQLCQGLQPLAALLKENQSGDGPLGEQVLTTLAGARTDLEQARTRLAGAEIALAKVRPEEQDATTRDALDRLSAKLPGLRNTVDALLVLPDLLGANEARTYLLVAENRDELRPTGGYIGTAGVVTVDGGKIERQEFGTSVAYDLSPDIMVPPPAPLVRYLDSSYWQLRDANWWPDFPSSAEQLAYFYNGTRDDQLNGVIAFDQHALELLLAATGPIAVPDYDETVTADNLQERLDYYVHAHPGLDEEYSRKQFVGSAAAAVIQTLTSAPPDRLRAYADALGQALAGKHLMLYLGESAAAHLAAELNWDGHLYQGAGDYVYAVHANVSPNKIDPYVERSMRYAVDLTASPPRARLTIDVKNTFDPTQTAPWLTTDYRDYLRVYVPYESALQSATGFADDAQTLTECGRTAFAGLIDVPPGGQTSVVLEYTLNAAVLDGGYSLAVQKQGGLGPTPLSVAITDHDGTITTDAALAHDVQYRVRDGALAGRDLPVAASTRLACAPSKPEPKVLAPPVTMSIPKIGVKDGPITALKVLPTGEMEVPGDGEHIGWYEASARPGAPGNFVSAAHVDWAGKLGVFWGLNELQPGDQIVVTDSDGVAHTYAVEWNKAVRPEDAPLMDIVGPSPDAIMTLITCTGNFNRVTRSYDHRQVVRARLVDGG